MVQHYRRRKTLHELSIGNKKAELPVRPDYDDEELDIIDIEWATAE